jgi:hypothetical protein
MGVVVVFTYHHFLLNLAINAHPAKKVKNEKLNPVFRSIAPQTPCTPRLNWRSVSQ